MEVFAAGGNQFFGKMFAAFLQVNRANQLRSIAFGGAGR